MNAVAPCPPCLGVGDDGGPSHLKGDSPAAPPSPAGTDLNRWFNDEVYPHDHQLKSYLRKTFPSVHDVEDVVQESYLRVWKARAGREIASAKAFLFTVARRLSLDLVRRDTHSPFVVVKDVNQLFVYDQAPDASQAANTRLEVQLLVAAVDSLPARCREAFILCHIEGLTQREAADRLGVAENTVAVQSARGLQRCEEYIRHRLAAYREES